MRSNTTATSTIFIPGSPALTADERADNFKNIDPKKIEAGRFMHDGLATNYYLSRANGFERMVIIGFSGANAQFPLNYEEIKRLNKAGATLICMALPPVGPDFMQRSEKLVRAFLKEKSSPANCLILSDAPQFIMLHSSSGAIITKLLGEEGIGKMLRRRFEGVGMLSPIWDVPYASRDQSFGLGPIPLGPVTIPALRTNAMTIGPVHIPALRTPAINIGPIHIPSFGTKAMAIGPVTIPSFGTNALTTGIAILPAIRPVRKIFELYADWNADKPFSDLKIVRQYIKLTTPRDDKNEEKFYERKTLKGMTMGHIRQIQIYARNVIDSYKPEHTAGMNIMIMTGDADNCTCWKTSQVVAKKMGAEFKLVSGGDHDLLKKAPALLDVFLAKAEERVALHEKFKATTSLNADTFFASARGETISLPPLPWRNRLSDGARLALQRSAGALNATASFF